MVGQLTDMGTVLTIGIVMSGVMADFLPGLSQIRKAAVPAQFGFKAQRFQTQRGTVLHWEANQYHTASFVP